MEEPMKMNARYRPREPNYYPAPPPEPVFTAPLDPDVLRLIRFLTFALVTSTISYGLFSLYYPIFKTKTPPRINLTSLQVSHFDLNLSTFTITARSTINLTFENPNKDWKITANPVAVYLGFIYNPLTVDAFIATLEANSSTPTLVNTRSTINKRLNNKNGCLNKMAVYRKRGVVPLKVKVRLFFTVFRMGRWPYWKSTKFEYFYDCANTSDVDVDFSGSQMASMMDGPRECALDVQMTAKEAVKRTNQESREIADQIWGSNPQDLARVKEWVEEEKAQGKAKAAQSQETEPVEVPPEQVEAPPPPEQEDVPPELVEAPPPPEQREVPPELVEAPPPPEQWEVPPELVEAPPPPEQWEVVEEPPSRKCNKRPGFQTDPFRDPMFESSSSCDEIEPEPEPASEFDQDFEPE